MIEILAVLGFPLAGGLALALVGHRREAAAVNIAASLATFAAAIVLTARVVVDGPMLVLDRLFFVVSSDPLDGVPIEAELRAASEEAARRGVKAFYWEPGPDIWQWVTSQASADILIARSTSYGQALTPGEDGAMSRELRLAPEDPPPSVLCVNKRADDFVVTFVDLRYGN